MQFKLYKEAKRAFKIDSLPCFNKGHIESYLVSKYEHTNTEKFKFFCDRVKPQFVIGLDIDEVTNIDYYPYMDTFKYLDEDGYLSYDESSEDIKVFDCTDGHYTDASCCCEECGASINREDRIYSEIDEMQLCQDCAIYIDERGEYCSIENADYNHHTGENHYCHDLDR